MNSFITPNVFLIKRTANIPIAIGKSMLLKKSTLEEIGGFWRFRNVLAEDHLIGRAIQNAGYSVITTALPVDNTN